MGSIDPLLGSQLGNYRLEQVIGRGGMASVYLGRDVRLERMVAVKVIDERYRADPDYAQRFVREARAIASLRHPHIVLVYQAGEENGLYYYAMEYVRGQDLRQQMKALRDLNQLLPFDEILRIGRAVASALDYAHARGVIHRDVKPSNVLISLEGRILLTDFGLALQSNEGTRGEVFGSPQYIAPEQARSSAQAVAQSDLYSLGVMLYEMLVGELPFRDLNPAVLAYQHISQPPPPPRSLNPDLSPAVESVLLRALRKQPDERYSSGQALMDSLDAALQGGDGAGLTPAAATVAGAPFPWEPSDTGAPPDSTVAVPGNPGQPPSSSPSPGGTPRFDPYATAAMPASAPQSQPAYPPPTYYPQPTSPAGSLPKPPPPPIYPPVNRRSRGGFASGWLLGCLVLVGVCGLAGFALYRLAASGGLRLPGVVNRTATLPVVETTAPAITTQPAETPTPEASQTPEPSQTPSPSPTITETPTPTATTGEPPTATQAPETMAHLVFEIRAGSSLLLTNDGPLEIFLEDLLLRNRNVELPGAEWEVELLRPQECVAVWQDRNPNQPTPDVECELVGNLIELGGDRRAWREPFEVLYRDELVGICDPQGNLCELDIYRIP